MGCLPCGPQLRLLLLLLSLLSLHTHSLGCAATATPLQRACRNYGGSRSIVVTIQGQKRPDGRRYGQFQ